MKRTTSQENVYPGPSTPKGTFRPSGITVNSMKRKHHVVLASLSGTRTFIESESILQKKRKKTEYRLNLSRSTNGDHDVFK